ncbi:MAG: HalOD1 output domain-containing protein [Halapricum sp.]
MSADEPYIVRDADGDADDADAWVAPEPASNVITDAIVAESGLARDDVEPLDAHVDFETLWAVLTGEQRPPEVSFSIEDWTVTVDRDGTVEVTEE